MTHPSDKTRIGCTQLLEARETHTYTHTHTHIHTYTERERGRERGGIP